MQLFFAKVRAVILQTVMNCVFLNALTPALSRRERGTKAVIRVRVEYIFLAKEDGHRL